MDNVNELENVEEEKEEEQSSEEKLSLFKRIINKIKGKKPINIERLDPVLKFGLSDEQVERRIKEGLVNVKRKKYKKSTLGIICKNLFTFFNFLCIICAIALIAVKASLGNFVFVVVYVTNLTIAIIQEIRAKITIEKLSIVNVQSANVIRNGEHATIPINEVVLDDIVLLEMGDQIPTDCKVMSGTVEVNESLLTGESKPVKKLVGDDLLCGSYITSGKVIAKADKLGDNCYIEKLSAKAKKFKKPQSELMSSLSWIIRIIGILIIPIGVGVFITNFNALGKLTDEATLSQVVQRTTAVIIGMIPSGMFLLTTLALSMGIIRLAKFNTTVQDMYSLEMLARVDVLCLDKTGTITDGRMKVANCIIVDEELPYSVNEVIASMEFALEDNNQTAQALRNYFGTTPSFVATERLPFSSSRKYSAVTFTQEGKVVGTFALGAPEFVLGADSKIPILVKEQIKRYSELGQRVLVLAYSPSSIVKDKVAKDIKPIAIITLTDNIRADAIQTIDWFKKNEVAIKVISGDNPITVSEVARRSGIENASNYISLEGMNDKEVINVANKYTVFGRVTPEQKALLIKSIKNAGHTVAMTGDGVNDILAMKESDCSITVATGSDATKNVAHLILRDNNFNSMPQVVSQGRRVINNIEKSSSLYLMKTLFTGIFAIISIIRRETYPFNNVMLIMLETIVIGLASLFLSLQPNDSKVKGKFISYVFAHAIPGALLLVFNIYVLEIFSSTALAGTLTPDYKNTMMVVGLTFGGLAYLYRVCEPFNGFRIILYVSLFTISLFWIFEFMPIFGMPKVTANFSANWQYFLTLCCVVQFDFPLSKFFIWATEKVRSSFNTAKIQ